MIYNGLKIKDSPENYIEIIKIEQLTKSICHDK